MNHREVIRELSQKELAQWIHSPLTAAVWAYLADKTEALRTSAADLIEEGVFDPTAKTDANPFVLRGRLAELRDLQGITLEAIQGSTPTAATELSHDGNTAASAPEGHAGRLRTRPVGRFEHILPDPVRP